MYFSYNVGYALTYFICKQTFPISKARLSKKKESCYAAKSALNTKNRTLLYVNLTPRKNKPSPRQYYSRLNERDTLVTALYTLQSDKNVCSFLLKYTGEYFLKHQNHQYSLSRKAMEQLYSITTHLFRTYLYDC